MKSFLNSRLIIKLIASIILIIWNGSLLAASMFWSVKNGQSEVLLLGSVHVATPSYYPLPEIIESNFKRSDVLVLEMNPLSMESQQQMQEMQQKSLYPNGDSLSNHLDNYTLELLQDFLKKAHLPSAPLLRMKPAILTVTLSMAKLATLGYTPANGIDMYFLQKAGNKMPVEELETAKMQMDLLLNMPKAETFLRYTLEQMDKIGPMMKQLDSAWKSGDISFMEKLLIEDAEKEYPELKQTNEQFLYQRNVGMANKIETYLKSGKTYFVIVGAAHLVGPKGIVALLQKKGYNARQY